MLAIGSRYIIGAPPAPLDARSRSSASKSAASAALCDPDSLDLEADPGRASCGTSIRMMGRCSLSRFRRTAAAARRAAPSMEVFPRNACKALAAANASEARRGPLAVFDVPSSPLAGSPAGGWAFAPALSCNAYRSAALRNLVVLGALSLLGSPGCRDASLARCARAFVCLAPFPSSWISCRGLASESAPLGLAGGPRRSTSATITAMTRFRKFCYARWRRSFLVSSVSPSPPAIFELTALPSL